MRVWPVLTKAIVRLIPGLNFSADPPIPTGKISGWPAMFVLNPSVWPVEFYPSIYNSDPTNLQSNPCDKDHMWRKNDSIGLQYSIHKLTLTLKIGLCSVAYRLGGMGGQCPGAPELKGPPRERQKRKWREEKKTKNGRKEKKRENETFQIPGRGPTTLVVITQSLKYKPNNGTLRPMFSFSGCMTAKMSQLKFEAHKFERVLWSRI